MKVLVATDKPFAKVAVDGIRREIEAAGYELVLLEKYGEKAKLLEAVKDANAIIIRSDIIDAEVLEFFKHTGKRYQSRINAVLRSYVDAHKAHAK